MARIEVLKSTVSDNYFYGLVDEEAGQAALVDPIDAQLAIERVRELGVELTAVINTHLHHDHTGGNEQVLEAFPEATLVAAAGDASGIDGVQRELQGGDRLVVGSMDLGVLETPGHTPGHISLLWQEPGRGGHLLSGDTIFVAGVGNCRFGGDPHVLYRTFSEQIAKLPDDTLFYPGHDYAERNLEFALSLDPDDEQARLQLERWRKRSGDGLPIISLGEERMYNPFMRYDDEALQQVLEARHGDVLRAQREESESEPEAVFCAVRELRNQW